MFMIFRQVKFQSSSTISSGTKRVAEEEILEEENLAKHQYKSYNNDDKPIAQSTNAKKTQTNKPNITIKSTLANLVKRKSTATVTSINKNNTASVETSKNAIKDTLPTQMADNQPSTSIGTALSLLSGYENSDSNESD